MSQLTVEGKPGSLYLSFSSGCPHALLREHLENFLNASRSLPLLLQGLCATEKTMAVLSSFVGSLPNEDTVSVSTISPPQVRTWGGEMVLTETVSSLGREPTKLERTAMVFSVAQSPWRRRGREREALRKFSRCSRRRACGQPLEKLR